MAKDYEKEVRKFDVWKDCPACGEHTYVVSIFGDVCATCSYRKPKPKPEDKPMS